MRNSEDKKTTDKRKIRDSLSTGRSKLIQFNLS